MDSEFFEPAQIPRAIVLGFTKEAKYKSMRLQLKAGDSIFLYSDGVTDAENKHGDLFSDEKLVEILSTSQEITSQSLIEHVKTEIDNFSHGVNQTDDITMLCFQYLCPPVSDM
jgi:sigma-B regulation protein RsbU (phosphoserine phosphatase)